MQLNKQQYRQCACNVTVRGFRVSIVVMGTQYILGLLSRVFVTLVIYDAKCMRRVILPSVACLSVCLSVCLSACLSVCLSVCLRHTSTPFTINDTIFEKKKIYIYIEQRMCVDFPCNFETFLILNRIQRNHKGTRLHSQYRHCYNIFKLKKGNGKVVPLQARCGPESGVEV